MVETQGTRALSPFGKLQREEEDVVAGFEPGTNDTEHIIDLLDGKSALLLIEQLPEVYQKIMHMRYIEDLSLQEMSVATGQSKNAVAVQAYRGLEKLRSLYIPA